MELLSDNAITEEYDDEFGFNPFVEILCNAILDTKCLPFTIGVFGEWGSGKTSFLHLLQKRIKDKQQKTAWFNPWKYDTKEELWTALIRAILLEISEKCNNDSLKKEILMILKNVSWLTFKKGISYGTSGFISERNIEKIKNVIVRQSKGEHEFLNKFESKFKDIVSKFVGEDGRLVIFIDDLDRCIPENAITVLESLKLYLDNSACVFVLGMDRTIVELGIKHRYGDQIHLSGREYLEKIVQLPFFLPPVQFGKLQKVLQKKSKACNYDAAVWTLLRYGLGGNPRKAKRFVNSFYMAQEALRRPEIIGELINDGIDLDSKSPSRKEGDLSKEDDNQLFYLAKALIIQMSYTEFYDYLILNPSGWQKYEEVFSFSGGDRNEALAEDPDLNIHWKDRRLYHFMRRTRETSLKSNAQNSDKGFPPPPSPQTLERILRFTGIVEGSGDTARERSKDYKDDDYKKYDSYA